MVHIFWSGYGFLVGAITFGSLLITQLITNFLTGSGAYWFAHKWPMAVALFFSSATCWLVGRHFDNQKPRVLIDPKTGENVVLRKSHTFFFITITAWGIILALFGLVVIAMEFIQ